MKVILTGAIFALAIGGAAMAQGSHEVRGYTRADGTYVAPHMQTNPNNTRADNYSTQGNVNPYTGQEGTKPLYPTPAPSYAPTTATCRDGTTSSSQNAAGTCSSHGGVAAWR